MCDYQLLDPASRPQKHVYLGMHEALPGAISASQLGTIRTSQTELQYFSSGIAYEWPNAAHPMVPRQPRDSLLDSSRNAELMRNYVERTSLELDLVIDSDPLWRRDALQASVDFPFLRHALMALSGLHIFHMNPPNPQSYYYSACRHSVRASELFRNSITNVTKHNWQPVLTFLIASVVFNLDVSFLSQRIGDTNHAISPASILLILRNPGSLSKQLASPLLSGPLTATLLRRRRRFQIPLDENVICAIERLGRFCEAELRLSPDFRVYRDAIEALRLWANAVSCHPRFWHDFVDWPVTISVEYIEILDNGDNFAAVIFVYWCAVMNRAPGRYYLAGIMKKIEKLATADLHPLWDTLLEWPRKELQSEPGLLFGWMV